MKLARRVLNLLNESSNGSFSMTLYSDELVSRTRSANINFHIKEKSDLSSMRNKYIKEIQDDSIKHGDEFSELEAGKSFDNEVKIEIDSISKTDFSSKIRKSSGEIELPKLKYLEIYINGKHVSGKVDLVSLVKDFEIYGEVSPEQEPTYRLK